MKDAGLVGADGRPRVPASRDELVTMAKRITKADTFGFAIGTVNPGRYTWGFHNLLWQNGANIYAADLKRAGVTEPAALEVAEFWEALPNQHKVAPPANTNCRDAFIAGRLGMWIAGSWNFTGLREAKVDFAAAPVPRLFKQPVVWSMPHQYSFPKPKAADRARRDAAWTHVRWMTDNVAEWTLKAGQVSASRKAHTDPRITGDPVLETLLAQAPDWQVGQPTPKWVAAENVTRPVIEASTPGRSRPRPRWRTWRARSTRCRTRARRAARRRRRRRDRVRVPGAGPPALRGLPRLSRCWKGLRLSFTNARLGRRDRAVRRARQLHAAARGHALPREPLEHRVLHGGQHAARSWPCPSRWPWRSTAAACGPCCAASFFFPFTLSVVTVGLAWLWLLDPVVGPFNYYLRALGVPARSWLADPPTAMWAIILTTVWWVTGYYLVIYLAGLQDIPRDLYEAAALDGAGGWRSFWAITLPLLRPVLLFVVVTHVIGSFQLFGQVFVLTGGGPGDATRTVVQHLYEAAFQNFFQFGAASAMAWVLFAVILVFSVLQFRLLRGHTEY